ncbi:unnamed protein product [[Candida] boidinii]|nr:unnamed protein product [[Candida] boidinii]
MTDADYTWFLERKKNPYTLLHLEHDGAALTEKEIRSAFRKRALVLHPDKNKSVNAQEEFREISTAYKIMITPHLKSKYLEYHNSIVNKEKEYKEQDEKQRKLKEELLLAERLSSSEATNKQEYFKRVSELKQESIKLRRQKQDALNVVTRKRTKIQNKKQVNKSVKLKWKNKPQLFELITDDVISKLMSIFGEVEKVEMSKSNGLKDNYHYATVTFHTFTSCCLSQLHDYSTTGDYWDSIGLRKIASLLRSCKLLETGFNDEKPIEVEVLSTDSFIGLTLLRMAK